MPIPFVHLRLHTEYSIEDSIIRINDLAQAAKTLELPAIALTDQMNLFASIKFYQAMSAVGIKPILGLDVWLANEKNPSQPFQCTLLCQNELGYRQLIYLVSRAYQERASGHRLPVIYQAWLQKNALGLIALSGGIKGNIGQALLTGKENDAVQYLQSWQASFEGRFYLELQRMGYPQEAAYIEQTCDLALKYKVPVVATQDIRFLSSEDFDAHEARVCIQNGYTLNDPKRPRKYTSAQYLKSASDMQTLFADIPTALTNTIEIAKRCNVSLELDGIHLPYFPVPSGMTAESYLIQEAKKGLQERLHPAFNQQTSIQLDSLWDQYCQQLKVELDVINRMGFAGYFLIVSDFIRWAKSKNIPVGPGRGSGAGSLVAYALKITDVDPLKYGLLFERFLNVERVSLPDFDIDFCMENRDQVIEYVVKQYGRDAVSQIITFGTMAARAVIRDVGRALGYPYGMVDSVAKLIPFEVGMTLKKAFKREEQSTYGLKARYDREDDIKILIDLAQKLEGLVRNVGTHAGGVVIAPNQLTEFTALFYEAGDTHAITQLDKDDIEKIGLVKFDFLGLRTLTIIDWAVTAINQKRLKRSEELINISQLSLEDPTTFRLLQSGKVTAVFQLESRGIRALLKRLKPDHFEDIVALLALFRPGPLQSGMVDDFIARKHDASQIRYLHPLLEPILRPTYGIILYQEQVMKIAQVLAGYSLGSADLLRRAMGKKKPEEMAKQRAVFIAGAEKNGIDESFGNTMFDLIEKFAGYGFNKSHSVAYALLSYQTAWLKAHYPTEFMAAVLSSEMEHTEKLSDLLYECRAFNLAVNPPNIHLSQYAFTVNEENEIEYGLGAIKGLGKGAIEHLLQVQKTSGCFQNLFDVCHRTDSAKINRRALEALIKSGSFDVFNEPRWTLMAQLETAIKAASQASSTTQQDLFGVSPTSVLVSTLKPASPWSLQESLQKEREVLGIYLRQHPIVTYASELEHFHSVKLRKVYQQKNRFYSAVWLVDVRSKFTQKGEQFAILLVEDSDTRIELRLSSDQYSAYRAQLVKDSFLLLELESYRDKVHGETQVALRQLWDISRMRETWGACLMLRIHTSFTYSPNFIERLQTKLKAACGGKCPVIIEYHTDTEYAQIKLGEQWRVQLQDSLLVTLQDLLDPKDVWVAYLSREG
jgi:DNA polymerase-3 subunit alpha